MPNELRRCAGLITNHESANALVLVCGRLVSEDADFARCRAGHRHQEISILYQKLGRNHDWWVTDCPFSCYRSVLNVRNPNDWNTNVAEVFAAKRVTALELNHATESKSIPILRDDARLGLFVARLH